MAGKGQSPAVASRLAARLAERTVNDPGYWDFSGNDKRSHGHALFPYPAMMVPQLQGALLDDLLAVDPTIRWCYDPFAGSGTILTECMRRGIGFVGGDLNPLAVLAMQVKASPLRESTLRAAASAALSAKGRSTERPAAQYSKLTKWFEPGVVQDLTRLHDEIARQPGIRSRRFLWICLAATVRLVSNSRTSTFKLHTYSSEHLASRTVDTFAAFSRVVEEAITGIEEHRTELDDRGLLTRGLYNGQVKLRQGDMLDEAVWSGNDLADVLMTSPPYGDNRTTVPYGQYSFLPLLWIETKDLFDPASAHNLLGSPYRMDNASVGGQRVKDRDERLRTLTERSDSLARTAALLRNGTGDGFDRFLSFCSDMDYAIDAIGNRLHPGGVQFWTLGNRRITGHLMPTTSIVRELTASRGAQEVTTITRRIPRNARRMATRNDSVPLMDSEQILVMVSPTSQQTLDKSRSEKRASSLASVTT